MFEETKADEDQIQLAENEEEEEVYLVSIVRILQVKKVQRKRDNSNNPEKLSSTV